MNEERDLNRGSFFYYGFMITASIGLFLVIRACGEKLVAPPSPIRSHALTSGSTHGSATIQALLALATILILSRAVGYAFRLLRQPPVVGEIVAGILLGPSLLGRIAPSVMAYLFPPVVVSALGVISQVGVMLFMFLVGLDLNPEAMRKRTHAALLVSHASILAPFLLGSALALKLYPAFSNRAVSFTAFALFLGVSISVTAFPVLARILSDRDLQRSRLGAIALTCAAADDVTAWCLLAFTTGVVNSRLSGAALTVLLTAGFILAMLGIVRPVALKLVRLYEARSARSGTNRSGSDLMAAACAAMLLSGLATEAIGIHALFGAFLMGCIFPSDSAVARDVTDKMEDFVTAMLLPAFFAFTGLRTQIALVSGSQWGVFLLILLFAVAGKFGGSAIAARLGGLDWRDATTLGALMNARGLMELIVLNVGLDLGVISPTLFAMLVMMAVVTTFMTTPILDLRFGAGGYDAEGEAKGITRSEAGIESR